MTRVIVTKSKLDALAASVSDMSGESLPLSIDAMKDAVDGYAPTLETVSKSYTPTESAQSETVTPSTGYDGIGQVSVSVGAVSPTYVGSGVDRRDSTDLSASGATVSVPAGYYASSASKAVASGTEGTPTAAKGTVSGHSVTVTPSVTNAAGYIAGGTHAGTGVSVSASELVSDTLTITAGGTYNVTNYASASVGTGSRSASATKGTVSGHSVTVTPKATTTAGYIGAGSTNGTAVTVSASELVSGTKSITSNGTGIDVTEYAAVDVAVPSGQPSLQAKTNIDPTTSSQTIQADSGYDGLSSVQINAMPSGVVVPAAAISSSSGATITTETGKIVLTKTVNNVPQVTTAGYVTSGTFGDTSVTLRATANIQGAQTITPGTSDQTIAANTWLTGAQTISGDANLAAGNIKSGTSIFGVLGTYTGGGTDHLTKIATKNLGTISTSSTSAADTGQTLAVSGFDAYDMLICICYTPTHTNGRHVATVRLINFSATSSLSTRTATSIATSTQHYKLSSSGTMTQRSGTTAYGVYVNGATISTTTPRTCTLTIYQRYNSTSSGTINGTYVLDVYGVKLTDLF